MLHKDYHRKGSVKKNGLVPQRAWRQDAMIGGKPPVESNFDTDCHIGRLSQSV
jgi:hypothetical protein